MNIRFLTIATLTFGLAVTSALVIKAQTQSGSAERMTNPTNNTISTMDQNFMMKAAQGGMAEVQLGNLALQHASSQAVKDFAQRMVDDHSKGNDELKNLAGQLNVTLPHDVDAKDKATMARLQTLNGAAFDRAYMRDMVTDHKKDIAEFQREANKGTDPQVKDWANKSLSMLHDHLNRAEQAR